MAWGGLLRCFSRADQRVRHSRCGAQHTTIFVRASRVLCSTVSVFRDQAAMDPSVSPTVAVGRVAAEIRTTLVPAPPARLFGGDGMGVAISHEDVCRAVWPAHSRWDVLRERNECLKGSSENEAQWRPVVR